MESLPQARKLYTLCYTEQKIKIVKIFDDIINLVDIDAETILLRVNNYDSHLKQSILEEIDKSRNIIINELNKIKNENLDNFDKKNNESEYPIVLTNDDLFIRYCVYLDSQTVRSFTFNKDRLGILLVTDFLISEIQAQELCEMASLVLKIDIKEVKGQDITIEKHFIENLMILRELKSILYSDQFLMKFSSKFFREVNEIEFSRGRICDVVKIKRLDSMLNRFTGLKSIYAKGNVNFNFEICQFEELKQLRVLEIRENKINVLCPQAFHSLPCLESLDISYNSIEELPDSIFSQLSNLKSLNLSFNPISIIKKATLNGLYNLEQFCFLYYQKTIFEKNVFEDLDNLKKIELKKVNLSNLDSSFEVDLPKILDQADLRFDCPYFLFLNWLTSANKLKRFSLHFNGNNKINNSYLINLYEVEQLSLSLLKLDIDKFPANFNKLHRIKLENVTFLEDPENLFSNLKLIEDIEIIDCVFLINQHANRLLKNLKNLKNLRYNNQKTLLDSNSIDGFVSINQIAKNNPCLKDLNLSFSSVYLDLENFGELKSLEVLNLSNTGIEYLCDKFFNELVNLKYLDLSNNKLTHITTNLFSNHIKNLIELNLSECSLTSIQDGMLSELLNIEKLNLSYNKIHKIGKCSFKGLSNLKNLDLRINLLTQLDDELFNDLDNLEDINLSNNRITKIDNLFDNNLKLKYLRLQRNEIKSINFRLLAKLVDLAYLNLVDNQMVNVNMNEFHYFMCCIKKVNVFQDSDYFRDFGRWRDFFGIANFK